MKHWGQKTKAEKYLEYVNDWLTIDAISDNYDMKIEDMKHLLNDGKIEHLENCCTIAKDKVKVLREAIKGILRNVNDNGDIHMMQGGKLQYELNEALKQTA
jgi:predicted Ser/Thr protein kinase